MANFKVGQRVRVISQGPVSIAENGSRVGMECVIAAIPSDDFHPSADCDVVFADTPTRYSARFDQLAPLTDPRAEEFIADMERFARVTKREPVHG